jgi:hypothetical protein
MTEPAKPVETNPSAAGHTTSEFKLTALAMIVGSILEAVAGVMHSLQDAGMGASWFAMAFAIIGALIQIAGLAGYQKGRTLLKAAMLASDAPTNPK